MTTPDTRLDKKCISNETEYEGIPEGWAKTTLQELLDVLESGSRPKGGVRGISEGIPSIGGEHLNSNGSFNLDSIKYVPQSFFDRMNQGHIQFNDVLVVKDGATTAKVSLVREDFPFKPAVVNEHVFICRPAKELYSPFLFYFLFSDEGQSRILENFRGSAQGGINHSFAAGTMVPLAPVAEQKRIVAKIEELLPRVNAAKERLKRASQIIKHFRQAVLSAACSGRLTEGWRETHLQVNSHTQDTVAGYFDLPDGWLWHEAVDFYDDARYGTSVKCAYTGTGTPVLRIPNIVIGQIALSDLKYAELGKKELETLLLQTGDIIVCRTNGSLDLIGKAAVVPVLPEPHAFASYLIRLRLKKSSLRPEYFHLFISSRIGRNQVEEHARTTAGQFNLNLRILSELVIPVPPVTEQEEIVRRVESLYKLADAIERRIEASRARADKLTQSILTKAFRGELIPTEAELARQEGRSYEPASVILERIKAEREKAPISQRRVSRR